MSIEALPNETSSEVKYCVEVAATFNQTGSPETTPAMLVCPPDCSGQVEVERHPLSPFRLIPFSLFLNDTIPVCGKNPRLQRTENNPLQTP